MYLLVILAGEDLLVYHVFKSCLAEKLSRHFNAVSQGRHVFPEKPRTLLTITRSSRELRKGKIWIYKPQYVCLPIPEASLDTSLSS